MLKWHINEEKAFELYLVIKRRVAQIEINTFKNVLWLSVIIFNSKYGFLEYNFAKLACLPLRKHCQILCCPELREAWKSDPNVYIKKDT